MKGANDAEFEFIRVGALQLFKKLRGGAPPAREDRTDLVSSTLSGRYTLDGLVLPAGRVPERRLLELEEALPEILASDRQDIPDRFPHLLRAERFATAIVHFAQSDEILDAVEQLLGPDIALWGAGIFGKPPLTGKATPWHQDAAFLEYQAIRPLQLCTAWIALDDSTAGNGCVRYVPGSHRSRTVYPHRVCNNQGLTLNLTLEDDSQAERNVQCAELERGQLSIHDVYLIHGSEANHSTKRRAGIALRYMPTTSYYDYEFAQRSGAPERTIYLVRGLDRCGTNRLQPA